MPRPTGTLPKWAYNPASPGDLVEPNTGKLEAGWAASERPPAQYFNWWMNKVGAWTEYFAARIPTSEELTYSSAKTRAVTLSPMIAGWGSGWLPNPNNEGEMLANFDSARWNWLVPLHSGCIVTGVKALVVPNHARPVVSDRMELSLYQRRVDWPGEEIDSDIGNPVATDDGTGDEVARQVISLSGLSRTVDNSSEFLWITLRAGTDAGDENDRVLALQVLYTDPGPRGF